MAILKQAATHEFNADHANQHSAMPEPEEPYIIMLEMYKVHEWFADMVERKLNEMLPYLISGGHYNWRDILGEDFFDDLCMPEHLARICLQHLAQQPDSPIVEESFAGCHTALFRLRTQHGEH